MISIESLVSRVPDDKQKKRLEKLLSTNNDDAIRLMSYRKTNAASSNIEGTFVVKGAKNRSGCRQNYRIQFRKQGTFQCTCPDHQYNPDIVCKHVSFIVCKVAKITDPVFFNAQHVLNTRQCKQVMDATTTL